MRASTLVTCPGISVTCHRHFNDISFVTHYTCFSDNLRYGVNFARKFIDGPDKKQLKKTGELRNLMNLHNNKAGRMVSPILSWR